MRPESFIKKEIYKKQLKILKEKNIYNIRDMTRAEKEKDLSIYNKEMYKIRINPHNKHPYTDSNNVCDWAGKNPNKYKKVYTANRHYNIGIPTGLI
jgi:hypothetical protein